MKRRFIAAVLAVGLLASIAISDEPRPAKTLVGEAVATAKAENKVVFMMFHASWCGWCHEMEHFMQDKEVSPIVKKHFVVLLLDCMEHPDKKALENPGVDAIVEKYGAAQLGLPSMFLIGGDGKTIATSVMKPGGNTGYPGQAVEIDHFLSMMRAAKLSHAELATIKRTLDARAAKLNGGV